MNILKRLFRRPLNLQAIIQTLSQPAHDPNEMPRRVWLCEQALARLSRQTNPPLWAGLHIMLGEYLSENPFGSQAENQERAIAAYETALTVLTRQVWPEDWARTQYNLGLAYCSRIEGKRAENLERAIAAYEAALLAYTREILPKDWAWTQGNLGAAYSDRVEGSRAENLERAIAAFEAALMVLTREIWPEDWARMQYNLGTVYLKRIEGSRAENLEQAIEALQSSLVVRTREALPQDWALTHYNLGLAYCSRIEGNRVENLKHAIEDFEAALLVYAPDVLPEQWAATQHNLALAYRILDALHKTARVFRLFVSSTFSDMVAERNALQEDVFPRLRELCFKHGARFQPIDLRWGISQEAGLSQRAVDLCLNEIRRCQQVTKRPNFLLLLGDRYGWCPLPDNIPVDEFDVLIERISSPEQTFVREWYWQDDNAVPAVYVLQPRRDEYVDKDCWNAVEARLRQILLNTLNGLEWSDEKRLKYEASVTEQEVTAGIFNNPDAQQSAFCFIRTIDRLPNGSNEFADRDEQAKRQLTNLKERLQEHIPDNIYSYHAQSSGNEITIEHLDQWCENVYNVLSQPILAAVATSETIHPLEVERETHKEFIAELTRHFVGRTNALQAVAQYIDSGQTVPLVLYGQSGVGKSTVMAQAIQQTQDTYPQAEILYRFIGVTPDSSSIRMLLIGLCEEIAQRYGYSDSVPQDYDELIKMLPDYLALATSERPLIVFLDALDQLQDSNNPSNLRWLPSQLPVLVRLVMSCIPGAHLDSLHRRLPDTAFFEIGPLQESFAEILLDNWLREAGRRLEPAQRAEVVNKFKTNGLPLYLKLAFEEARLWHSYTAEITLQPDVFSLLRDNLFARLADKAEHGEMLVSRSLGYLAASRNGLSEDEILDILAQDEEFWTAFLKNAFHTPPGRHLPMAVWSRFRFDLAPYLIERRADGALLLTFYHHQFSETVNTLYLGETDKTKRHAHLAHVYEAQPLFLSEGVANSRKLAEQPYQQANAHLKAAYINTLVDYPFLQASLIVRGPQALMDDCELMPDETTKLIRSSLSMSAHVLGQDRTALAHQLGGRLMCYRNDNPDLRTLTDGITPPEMTLYPAHLDSGYPTHLPAGGVLILTLAGHLASVTFAEYSPDGRRIVSASVDTTLKVWDAETGEELLTLIGHLGSVYGAGYSPDGRRIVSGSSDTTLKVWDAETGEELLTLIGHSALVSGTVYSPNGRRIVSASYKEIKIWDAETGEELITLTGHSSLVSSVAYSPNGRRIVSASWDKTVKVWDAETGEELITLTGHWAQVNSAGYSPDGRRIVSASHDMTLKIWDAETGKALLTLPGHSDSVTSGAYSPDGQQIVSGFCDYTLKVWDAETGRELMTLPGHSHNVNRVRYSPDGQRIVSASYDHTLKVWNAETSKALLNPLGHSRTVWDVRYSPDGRHIISASTDETLKVWNAETGRPLQTLTGHSHGVRSAGYSPDGQHIISGSNDNTLRVWDAETGEELMTLTGHSDSVTRAAYSPDGRRIISASEDNTLKVWNTETGEELMTLTGHSNMVRGAACSPDGRRIVSASWDNTLKIWDAETGEELLTLTGHLDNVTSVAYSPDGRRIVSASWDNTLKIWDAETGEELLTLTGHSESVSSAAYNPDGRRIVSASWDNTLRVWNAESGCCLHIFHGDMSFFSCTWSPDGHNVVAGDDVGRVLFLRWLDDGVVEAS